MKFSTGLTLANANELKAARDKLVPPSKGTRINGGIHGPVPDLWDGSGQVPPGWTGFPGLVQEGATYNVAVPDDLATLDKSALSAAEKTALSRGTLADRKSDGLSAVEVGGLP